ncbi:unnamed protein product [Rhizophagus irregularis]|nr:unnamed protein product [Rhizophagus irregularis]
MLDMIILKMSLMITKKDNATGDFTKQYNRLRQKLQSCGTLSGSIKYQQGPSERSSLSAGRGDSSCTGKEANFYHAITEDGNHRAIKVYETSILVFKDRDRYVTGEFRFRHGHSKHNPRKMVKLWAGKEMRNLKRLWQAGIPCPEPLVLGLHALVMIFLRDKNGWAYPRLKDAVIHSDKYSELYYQLIKNMIIMYHKCRLVHADLNEYNLLYRSRDISNVTEYFKRKGVRVIGELFDFITDINIGLDDEQVEAELDKIQERLASQQELSITLNEDIDKIDTLKVSKDEVDLSTTYWTFC